MSGDPGERKARDVAPAVSASNQTKNAKETKTMGECDQQQPQKPDLQKLIQLVHSCDIQACNESATALRELLLNGDSTLLCGLLSQYVQTNSEKLLEVIANVRHPLDKVLLDQLTDIWRVHPQACLSLVSQLILKQVPWLHKFPQHASFGQFLKAMRSNSDDLSYCTGVALVLASLVISMAPLINTHLSEIFNAFLFLAGVLHRRSRSPSEETPYIRISLLHFRLALYALFQRLYGLFPCHFLTFLRQNFAGPQTTAENRVLYQEIIRPMLDIVKLHPLLVTANKEGELAKERWVGKEMHDILAECNRVAGDPYENCIAEDNASSSYFQRGLVRPSSSSNFLPWTNSFASRPSSSLAWFSNKATPVKDGSTATSRVTPKVALSYGHGDGAEKRQVSLVPIVLPSAASSSLQKSASDSNQQQASYWSPSDTVGLSTPPEEETGDEGRAKIPELRLKPSERNRTTLQTVGRKTSMAAGPETPAPHTRSFRTGSWGADARQKFLQNRQRQQQSSSTLLQPDRKSAIARRSFGQAFAKLFHRPAGGAGSSSVPQSPSVCRPANETSFDFDFEPREFRPMTSVRQLRESGLNQQAELAEEADEACTSSTSRSTTASRNGAGSLVSSKRPSVSEPVLFPPQPITGQGAPEEMNKEISEPVDLNGNGVTLRKLSTILKTLAKENDENLLEDAELQRYWTSEGRSYATQIHKRSSLSSSRTSSSAAVISAASGDRTRHSSSATATSGAAVLQGALSRHSSLLDTQAVSGNNGRASMTPPVGIASGQGLACGVGDRRGSGQRATGFTLGAPDDNDEDDELSKLRTSTDVEHSDSVGDDGPGALPRLSTSQSLADFISRMNRIRFDSRCVVGEEPQDEAADQHIATTVEKSPNSAVQQPMPATAAALPAEFRRRGSTFSGVVVRPCSCPPSASAAVAGSQASRMKQDNAADRSVTSDEAVEKELAESEESRPYEALLLLTRAQTIAPPAIPIRPSPYQLLDDYMAAASALHSGDHSWPVETKEETPVGDIPEKAAQSPKVHSSHKASTAQRKASATQQYQGHPSARDAQKDVVAALKSEIQDLQTELTICKQRVFYERHQRLLHAERNRRLYGRLKQATTLDEQNQAQRDQLRLQENEVRELTAALTELRRHYASQRQESISKEYQLTSRLQALQRENETTKSSLMASKRTGEELLLANSRLRKELGGFVQKLFDKEAAYAQLQEQCANDLPSTKHSLAQLNKELFLMGETNRRLRDRMKTMKLRQEEIDSLRERLRSSEETAKQESSTYRRLARRERHRADAAHQRIQELDAILQKRQAQIAESKRRLDQASEIHQEQLAACQMKYAALMMACQRQEAHVLELYEKLEAKHIGMERRKSGVCMVERGAFSACERRLSGGNDLVDGDDTKDGDGGVDIPARTGTASEIRSYDSYHSASYLSQHQGGTAGVGPSILSASVASVGSCQSTDLYLPYLFSLEFQAAQQQRNRECQDASDDQVDGEEGALREEQNEND